MDEVRTKPKYSYYGYGLKISSDIELPLPEADRDGNSDVHITFGKIPENIECERKISSYSISQDAFILNLKNADIFAGFGREIIIEFPGDEEFNKDDTVPFLLSSCIGALLHQRNTLALHASSVMTKNGAVVFMGTASSGKSTLASVLERKGYGVLSDDICPVDMIDGNAVMVPSGEKLQIWKDIISALKIPPEFLKKIRPSLEKYYYGHANPEFKEPVNISAIYLLNPSNEGLYEIRDKFSGNQKLNILKNHICCKNFAKEMFIENKYYKKLKHLSGTVPLKEFVKPNIEFKPEKLTDILEKDFL